MERDAQFVYLALERCAAALHDVMEPPPGAAPPPVGGKTLQFLLPSDAADSASAGQHATAGGCTLVFRLLLAGHHPDN